MASRNVIPYEPMDKMPSNTLKRHPKMDLNKNDLLRLLSHLEGELQARDIAIAALKAEKAKQLLYQAKYGRFGLGDPFHAMQRDSDRHRDNSFDETAVKAMYDNQLLQLENLIATQRKAQQRMREQLTAVEKRYHKVCAELEDEKQKHAIDTAQGDDVTYMLEKDRERLKQELDFEKGQNKKQDKENKKLTASLEEEQAMSTKHKQVALMLIKERKHYMEKLAVLQHQKSYMESALKDDTNKMKSVYEGLAQESHKGLLMEAAIEKQLSEFDIEREQLKGRLAREENRNKELSQQVQLLKQQLDPAASQRGVSPSSSAQIQPPKVAQVFKNTPPNTPPEVRRVPIVHMHNSSDNTDPSSSPGLGFPPVDPSPRSLGLDLSDGSPSAKDRTMQPLGHDKPAVAEKPPELNTSRVNVISSGGPAASMFSPPSGNTTVFTTPSGTRISLNVGASGATPRKPGPGGRGVPPPLPPNKPQVYIPSSGGPGPRRDNMSVAPQSSGNPTPSPDLPSSQNNDSFGPEMDDLQKLLVSMATDIEFIKQKQKDFDIDSSTSGASESDSSVNSPQSSSSSVSSSSSSLSSSSDVSPHTLQKIVTSGNLRNLEEYLSQNPSTDLTTSTPDGSTLLHLAAELGHYDTMRLLLDKGCSSSATNADKATPLHLAATEGNSKCISVLLDHNSAVDPLDKNSWTALHWAATNGHLDSCQQLLSRGARIDAANNSSWTPVHMAIHSGHSDCLQLLLTFDPNTPANQSAPSDGQSLKSLVEDVVNLVDKDGWTVAHLASIKETKVCLEVLSQHCDLDLDRTDVWGRDVRQVASEACRDFILSLENNTEKQCKVYVNVPESRANKCIDAECHVGNLKVTTETTWPGLEESLSAIYMGHLSEVEAGVKTRRAKHEGGGGGTTAGSPDGQLPFSLGLSLNSVKFYSIGVYHWSPGTPTERTPWELLCSMNTAVVAIQLFGMDDGCVDSLSYETLIPVAVLQNYLRLMEQYKNVIFYGPLGTGKSYMAKKLAQVIQMRDRGNTDIHVVTLTETFSPADLIRELIDKGCLVPSTLPLTPAMRVSLLVLDDLHKISVAALFKDVFPVLESRGPGTTVHLQSEGGEGDYYMHPSCFILGTMDRTRSTGLELSIQQRFRWVQFRCDQEPMRCLLHRHLQRRLVNSHGGVLPSPDDKVHRAVEWVICVWQRLNEGLQKLGLVDMFYGPVLFLQCPVEPNKPKAILRWLSWLWNQQVAPAVSAAVLRGSGTDTTSEGQQKVANTALYVLMQRAIVSGCPLSGQEKERYISSFMGSNELDIKMGRGERRDSSSSVESPRTPRKMAPETLPKEISVTQSGVSINAPFHRSPRSPMMKSASLDSAPSESDSLELPDQPLYHTSPDLSSNGPNNTNTYFALAGFPVAKPMVRTPTKKSQPPPNSPKGSRFGVPVIVTQPSSSSVYNNNQVMSRSFEGSIPDGGKTSDAGPLGQSKRALSPQPVGSKAWSPGPDPRRAFSPGPDFYRNSPRLDRNGNGGSEGGAISTTFTRPGAVGVRGPSAIGQGRFPAPVVVNPTRLQPLVSDRQGSPFKS